LAFFVGFDPRPNTGLFFDEFTKADFAISPSHVNA